MKKVVAVLCHGVPNREGTGLSQEGNEQVRVFAQAVPATLKTFSPESNIVSVHATLNPASIESMFKFAGYLMERGEDVDIHHEQLRKGCSGAEIWALANELLSYDDGIHVIFAQPSVARSLVKYLEDSLGRTGTKPPISYGCGSLVYQGNTLGISQPRR